MRSKFQQRNVAVLLLVTFSLVSCGSSDTANKDAGGNQPGMTSGGAASPDTSNLIAGAISVPEVSVPKEVQPSNAMAFAGKYPSEKIGGFGVLDAPDLKATIKAMPNGSQIWSQIISEDADLQLESTIAIINPGPNQGIVIHKCEAHNCGGAGSRQLHIEYFPSPIPADRLVFVCILRENNLQSFDSWGNHSMEGEECTTGGFDYGDAF